MQIISGLVRLAMRSALRSKVPEDMLGDAHGDSGAIRGQDLTTRMPSESPVAITLVQRTETRVRNIGVMSIDQTAQADGL